MKLKINHTTEYTYSDKVFFEPHYFRFKPKSSATFTIDDFGIVIEPQPTGLSQHFDSEHNHLFLAWFEEKHQNMKIEAHVLLDTQEFNPFNFLVYPAEFLKLPFVYGPTTKQLLLPSLQSEPLSEPMHRFVKSILQESNHQTVTFLTTITQQIHVAFSLEWRETGSPLTPTETFTEKRGSCRDLSWMLIHMLRNLGMAARFVSGYLFIDEQTPSYELHAWVDVYLPGAGWVGFDPSHGLLASNYHVPIASSAFYENTMPVSGTIRGSAKHWLSNQLNIALLP